MNGHDVQEYFYVVNKCKENGLELGVNGHNFTIYNNDSRNTLGLFNDLEAVRQFVCGYECGYSAGYVKGFNEEKE